MRYTWLLSLLICPFFLGGCVFRDTPPAITEATPLLAQPTSRIIETQDSLETLVEIEPENPDPDICVVPERFSTARLTPVWSPVGDKLAVGVHPTLYLIELADGYPARTYNPANISLELAEYSVFNAPMSWFPNGNSILFVGLAQHEFPVKMFVLDLETGQIEPFDPSSNNRGLPVISRDGSQVAYVSTRGISIVDTDNAAEKREFVLSSPKVSSLALPSWSPDGNMLAYLVEQNDHINIMVSDLQNEQHSNLTPSGVCDYDPVWSPTGEYIAFYSNRNGNWDLFIMRTDGSQVQQLTNDNALEHSYSWSNDGKRIVFVSSQSHISSHDPNLTDLTPSSLYLVNIEGEEPALLIEDSDSICCFGNPVWSPTGEFIAFSHGITTDCEFHRACPHQINLIRLDNSEQIPIFTFEPYDN